MTRGRATWIGLLGLLIGLGAIAAWLCTSAAGSRWLVQRAIAFAPGEVTLDGVSGTLASRLAVAHLHVVVGSTVVSARDLSIDPDWTRSLLRGALALDAVRAEVLRIDTPAREPRAPAPFQFALPGLPLPLEIAQVTFDRLEIDRLAEDYWPQITGGVSLHADRWVLTNVEARAPAITAHGHLEAAPFDRIALSGRITWRATDARHRGDVRISGDLDSLRLDAELARPLAVSARARVGLLGRLAPELDIEAHAPHVEFGDAVFESVDAELRVVLTDEPDGDLVASAEILTWANRRLTALSARASGTVDAYTGEARGDVEAEGLPPAHLESVFEGSREGLRLRALKAKTEHGAVESKGTLAFAPWQLDLAATLIDVDPNYWLPQVTGAVSGPLTLQVAADRLAVETRALSGRLNDAPFTLSGSMARDAATWTVPALTLRVGDNLVEGSGVLGASRVEARGRFGLERIAQLYPAAAGDAVGEFRVSGTREVPTVELSLSSERLELPNVSTQGVEASVTMERAVIRTTTATAARFAVAGYAADSVRVAGRGRLDAFEATVDWHQGEAVSNVAVAGGWGDGVLDLRVLDGARLGFEGEAITLDRTVALRLHAPALTVAPHCWRRVAGAGELCIDGLAWGGTEDVLTGRLAQLPLPLFNSMMPALPPLGGLAEGHWQLIRRNQTWQGDIALQTSGLRLEDSADDEAGIPLPDLKLLTTIGAEGFSFTAGLGEGEAGVLTANLSMPRLDETAPLTGQLRFDFRDLAKASQFSRRIGAMTGRLEGEVTVSGTRAEPQAVGRVALLDGKLTWADPRVELSDLALDLTMSGRDRIEIAGTARGTAGTVKLMGQLAQPFAAERALELDIVGDNLEVTLPEGTLTASSDLKLVWHPGTFDLTGSVTIPRARIVIKEMPRTSVSRSDDVIVVDREFKVTTSTRLAIKITINLGDDVRFAGFGLDTGLRGRLRLAQGHDGTVTLNGTLSLVKGTFEAFGQTLTIERGRLTYSGPFDNPGVSARAIREIEEDDGRIVTAGVNISGPAASIESTLFSRPAMPEAEILSYLVLGRGLGATTEQESNQMTGAAIGLGLKGAAPLIDEVRSAVGLEELTASGSSSEELALVAGKRISDRVFVRYTYQTFTRLSALLIRLALTDRLSLEATAAEIPAMDLLYRVGGDG